MVIFDMHIARRLRLCRMLFNAQNAPMYKLFDVHIARRIASCAYLYNVRIALASYGATY